MSIEDFKKGEYIVVKAYKFKRTKLHIFFIAVKILLCFALLIGSTYALFTDNDEKNVFVTAASLEMELYTLDINGNMKDISGKSDNIFGDDDWEPGQTRVVFFKVRSVSDIDAKYTLNLVLSDNVLDGAFEYCAFEGGPADYKGMKWESIAASNEVHDLVAGQNPVSSTSYSQISPNGEHYYTLFIHMSKQATSSYQNKQIDIKVHLYATQGNTIIE